MTGYVFTHEGKQYDPDGLVQVADSDEHNRQLERAELAAWAEKPDRWSAYIKRGTDNRLRVTTWLGSELGKVIDCRRFHNNLTGSEMSHVRVAGNNGATYHGTYGSEWSEFVRLRKCKSASRQPRRQWHDLFDAALRTMFEE